MQALSNASVNLRMASKRVQHEIKHCNVAERACLTRVKRDIENNDAEDAAIEARAAIRHHNRALQLKHTMHAMRVLNEQIQTAIRTRTLHRDMQSVVRSLDALSATMPMEQVQRMFERFEQHQEDMQVAERVMNDMTQRTTASLVPDDQVAALIQQVATAHSLQLNERFSVLRPVTAQPVAAAAAASAAPVAAPPLMATPLVYGGQQSAPVTAAAASAAPSVPAVDPEQAELEERLRRLNQ